MKTSKYKNLFRCDYNGKTVIAPTRQEARKIMMMVIFGEKKCLMN